MEVSGGLHSALNPMLNRFNSFVTYLCSYSDPCLAVCLVRLSYQHFLAIISMNIFQSCSFNSFKDFKVSFAVKQGLSQAMQIRRKVTVVSEPSPTQSDSPAIEDLNQEHTLMDEGPVAVEQVRNKSMAFHVKAPLLYLTP